VRDWFFPGIEQSAVIVFHCELSHDGGPRLAAVLRDVDRRVNRNRYPVMFYPRLFVLDGGYREFYERFKSDCEGGYRPMRDGSFAESGEMARETRAYRQSVKDYVHRWKRYPMEEMAARWIGTRSPGQRARALSLPIGVQPCFDMA
jgi:M-phase inducer tyrosine phosphatase